MMAQKVFSGESPPSRGRFILGIVFFLTGLFSPGFIPLVVKTNLPTHWKTIISGLLTLGIPEVLWMAAVAVLGKSGFNYLKGRLFAFLKRHAPPDRVSLTRYRIGLVMFVLPLLFAWLAPYAPHLVPGYMAHRFWVNFGGDLLFLSSLFVLGGDFWDKIRALFIHEATAQFPGNECLQWRT
ncbi:hypothetical protein ACFL0O_04420 [Thermodesulfobacteriota bacterium]